MGGWKKEGGGKPHELTPLPKRGFGPPLVRYVFHPPQASALCFSCAKIHDRADQKLFWRGPKIFSGERVLWYVLVNLFLANLVRISGFSSLFLAIAVLSAHFAREC